MADLQEEFQAAGVQLAIAANCRATYGENELFEVAFARFEELAREADQGISDKEMEEAKLNLYEMEAETGDNPFMRGFCNMLKEELLPVE